MKIAIPSNDGLMIKCGGCSSKAFLVATIDGNVVVSQELRWNLLSEMMTSPEGIYYNLLDCDLVLLNGNSCGLLRFLKSKNIEVKYTAELTIVSALANVLSPVLIEEN